ncbi:MAG TPA: DUF3073 domain-containing protein [Acidothermaceae bacterium]|nr:DUF3073 domain-containing protein [Acidothermaceae bacterium]
MGRGRAKAKQAKVARQLKYSGAGTDLEALRKELVGGSTSSAGAVGVDSDSEFDDTDDELDDEYDSDDDDSDDEDDPDDLGRSYRAGGGR